MAALIAGAELLVRGASRMAGLLSISPLVIGLTVVAFGTSAPELAVSLRAAVLGQPDLAVGNVLGSNIFNVLLILGVSALARPLVVERKLVRLDVPVMIAVSAVVWLLGLDGRIGRLEGAVLFAGILFYVAFQVLQTRKAADAGGPEARGQGANRPPIARGLGLALLATLGGLTAIVFGARWLVEGSVAIARALGVSELLIGLTLVAAGTSLPEAATSVVATLRGERDLAVGNVVGSNLFNLLAVLGGTAALSPHGLRVSENVLRFDLPLMVAVAVVCLPIFFTGFRIDRWEGALLVALYGAYVAFLALGAQGSPMGPWGAPVMIGLLLSLSLMTLARAALRASRAAGG